MGNKRTHKSETDEVRVELEFDLDAWIAELIVAQILNEIEEVADEH
ncbi:hypothetical protein JYU19_02090 [bacterium AH-315-J21]|nr:hypothetical protein [bacterium AH-315-J21]